MNVINQYIQQNFPDINRRGGYEYGDPNPGANASTAAWSGVTTLPGWIRCKKLSLDEFERLFDTMPHESMHSTDNPLQVAWDLFWGNGAYISANHQGILNRISYETLLGHRARPSGPMWNMWRTPRNAVPDVDGHG
jgi:hypothetical protein